MLQQVLIYVRIDFFHPGSINYLELIRILVYSNWTKNSTTNRYLLLELSFSRKTSSSPSHNFLFLQVAIS